MKKIAILGKYTTYPSYFNYGLLQGMPQNDCWGFPIPLLPQKDLSYISRSIDFIKPDILLCHCIFDTKPWNRDVMFQILRDVRKKWGTKICYHCGDSRDIPRYPHDVSDFLDLGLLNSALTEEFSNYWKIPVIHFPYGCLPQKRISDKQNDLKFELVFTGSLDSGEHHGERKIFIEELQKKIKIKKFPDEKYGNSMFITDVVSASSDAILGTQLGKHIKGNVDVRPFQYIGAGAVYFHENHPNIQSFFRDCIHYVSYDHTDIDNFLRKYNEYKDNWQIRERAFEFCQENHSVSNRIRMILDYFDGKKMQGIYLR